MHACKCESYGQLTPLVSEECHPGSSAVRFLAPLLLASFSLAFISSPSWHPKQWSFVLCNEVGVGSVRRVLSRPNTLSAGWHVTLSGMIVERFPVNIAVYMVVQ